MFIGNALAVIFIALAPATASGHSSELDWLYATEHCRSYLDEYDVNKYKQCVEEYSHLISSNIERSFQLSVKSTLMIMQGDIDGAALELKSAIELIAHDDDVGPFIAEHLAQYSDLMMRLEKYDLAKQYLRKADRIFRSYQGVIPDNDITDRIGAYIYLVFSNYLISQRRYDAALEKIETAEAFMNGQDVMVLKVKILFGLGNVSRAKVLLDRILGECDLDDINRAEVYLLRANPSYYDITKEEALKSLQKSQAFYADAIYKRKRLELEYAQVRELIESSYN